MINEFLVVSFLHSLSEAIANDEQAHAFSNHKTEFHKGSLTNSFNLLTNSMHKHMPFQSAILKENPPANQTFPIGILHVRLFMFP